MLKLKIDNYLLLLLICLCMIEDFKTQLSCFLKIDIFCGVIIGFIYSILGFIGLGLAGLLISLIFFSILWIIVGMVLNTILIFIYRYLPSKSRPIKIFSFFLIFLVLIPTLFILFGNINFSFGRIYLTNILALFLLFITSLIFSLVFIYSSKKIGLLDLQ